jgi:hypothetical protein
MAKNPDKERLNMGVKSGSSGTYDPAADTDDAVTEEQLDRIEAVTGRRDNTGKKLGDRDPGLDRELDKLAAGTEEEVDALRVNLTQDAGYRDRRDGTGPVVDDLARERMAAYTETGRESNDRGAESVTPGRDDTSSVLRRHHPNSGLARAQDVVEGNLDEPREESRSERKVDEGTAA